MFQYHLKLVRFGGIERVFSPRSTMSHLCAFIYPGPQDSTAEYREEKDVRLHHADLARDSFHSRKGKKSKPIIATVNVASVQEPTATSIPFEEIDRSNKRAARCVYPKVNEIDMTVNVVKINKVRKTPRQLRILFRAINRGRLQKFDTSYLVDEATLYAHEEELPPRYNQDDDDDWGYGLDYTCTCKYCR